GSLLELKNITEQFELFEEYIVLMFNIRMVPVVYLLIILVVVQGVLPASVQDPFTDHLYKRGLQKRDAKHCQCTGLYSCIIDRVHCFCVYNARECRDIKRFGRGGLYPG
ncbi:unnamed protein product, partial [Owenia fusiformis]